MNIKGKVFVITGVSSGLGFATAEMILGQGGSVIGIDLEERENLFHGFDKDRWMILKGDVQSPDEVRQCIQEGLQKFEFLHGAIACAGIAPAHMLYSEKRGSHPFDLFMKVMKVNTGGTFNLFNEALPFMLRQEIGDQERGVLIATSSIASSEGQFGQVAYAASKGGVSGMILPLARELSRHKIRVNAISPGIFETPMVAGFSEKVQKDLAAQVPFPPRLGNPREFADLVRTILENEYINGAIYRLDGGVRMN